MRYASSYDEMRAASSELPGYFCRSISFSLASRSSRARCCSGRHLGRRLQIDDRVVRRAEHRALIRRRHEARAPVRRAAERSAARIVNHHERRQALVLRPQPIRHPRPHARKVPSGSCRCSVRNAPARDRSTSRTPIAATPSRPRAGPCAGRSPKRPCRTGRTCLKVKRARHQRPGIPLPHHDLALAGQAAGRHIWSAPAWDRTYPRGSTPPLMNSEITLLARGAKCGFFGAYGL